MVKGGDSMHFGAEAELCKAINSHCVVDFFYDGEKRTVEPYTVFIATTGNTLLFGIQTKSNAFSLPKSLPKYFNLDNIYQVEISGPFTPDPTYSTWKLRFCDRVIATV
jgi:hypothetical protein